MTERNDPGVSRGEDLLIAGGHADPRMDGAPADGYAPGVDLSFLDGAEQEYAHWSFLKINGDRGWAVNNSSIFDYSRRAYMRGQYVGLAEIISERLGYSGEGVGLDVAAGSSARALRDLLDVGVLGRALATNYQDRRPRGVKRDPRLDHLQGDLTKRETWNRMIGWQSLNAPEGFDLVMHRPVGGLQDLELPTYRAAAHILFNMVKPGGMMFSQVPRRVVNMNGGLRDLCHSIRARDDVEDIETTAPRPRRRTPKDESDMYAVLFKK